MRFLIIFFLAVRVFGDDGFITALEYGKLLYQNPRGIGCIKCHGEKGEGGSIANYTNKRKVKNLIAPQINDLDFKSFKNALQKGKKVMPKYYLTEVEIKVIYEYLQSTKKEIP